MSQPRQKPWEGNAGASGEAVGSSVASTSSTINTGAAAVPERPTSLSSEFNNVGNSTPYGSSGTGYGTGYGNGGYGSRYGSSYGYGSSMGGYGSSMYGGMGGYGSSMYGGMGGYGSSMYGGMGGYGSGMYGGYGSGMYGQPGMGGGLGEGTQATFQLIESIIGAVGGFAQMLEATYMATHSSFFTMVNLAEQFGNLKNALGSLLGIYALINFGKKIFYKLTGSTYNYGLSAKEFTKFEKTQKKLEYKRQQQASGKKRISLKPLLIFLVASIGFPYLLNKAIQKLNEKNLQQQHRQQGQLPPGPIDPANLQFAKALYEFNPENPNIEVELKAGELVAILSKLDPAGNESKWWKVRSRHGKIGYVPSNYLTVIERKQIAAQAPAAPQQIEQPQVDEKAPLSVSDFENFQKSV